MTTFEIANDPAFGFGVVQRPPSREQLEVSPTFPTIQLGSDRSQWAILLSMLFSAWAYYHDGRKVVVRVADDGNAEAWMTDQSK